MLSTLDELGFAEASISHDQIAHRFSRGRTNVDVLAPDGVGPRTNLRPVGAAQTVEVGGGSYALTRSGPVSVSAAGRSGEIPRPDLAGAILIKAVAATRDTRRGPERHLTDLAFLLSLVEDPIAVRDDLGAGNCTRIRHVMGIHDRESEAWTLLGDDAAATGGHAAFRIITRSS